MDKTTSITVVTVSDDSDTKGALPFKPNLPKQITIEPNDITSQMHTFLDNFQKIFEEQSQTSNNFIIDEIELNLAINASGGIELIGKATAGIEGGIKVKLKRKKREVDNDTN